MHGRLGLAVKYVRCIGMHVCSWYVQYIVMGA